MFLLLLLFLYSFPPLSCFTFLHPLINFLPRHLRLRPFSTPFSFPTPRPTFFHAFQPNFPSHHLIHPHRFPLIALSHNAPLALIIVPPSPHLIPLLSPFHFIPSSALPPSIPLLPLPFAPPPPSVINSSLPHLNSLSPLPTLPLPVSSPFLM